MCGNVDLFFYNLVRWMIIGVQKNDDHTNGRQFYLFLKTAKCFFFLNSSFSKFYSFVYNLVDDGKNKKYMITSFCKMNVYVQYWFKVCQKKKNLISSKMI